MEKYIHPNANKSSNLLRLSALLTLVAYFLFSDRKSSPVMIATLITISLLIGAAYLIRRSNNWVRWVLLVLFILGVSLDVFLIPSEFKLGLANGCFAILQDIIQLVVVLLLFIPYKVTQVTSRPIGTIEP
jgi:hypothetical protein